AALGVGLVIGTTNKISMAALSTWQKVMLVGGVACVGAGGAMTYTHFAAESVVATPATTVETEISEASVSARDVQAPVETPALPPLEALERPARGETAAAPVIPSSGRGTERIARESSVKAELGLLEQARAHLSGGNPSAALQVLGRYAERHPRGNMRLEAEVLKVEAPAASGRTQEASRLAARLLVRYPKSVVASRLRRFASKD